MNKIKYTYFYVKSYKTVWFDFFSGKASNLDTQSDVQISGIVMIAQKVIAFSRKTKSILFWKRSCCRVMRILTGVMKIESLWKLKPQGAD